MRCLVMYFYTTNKKGRCADSYAAFDSFHNWATSGIHKQLSCVKRLKHLRMVIPSLSQTDVTSLFTLTLNVPFSTKMVTGSSDTGDCFDKNTPLLH